MASWNGSHPQEENHNYSYANSRYPENVESFPASWAYYPPLSVQQNSADAVGQLQSTAFSNQSLQTNFAIPPPSHYLGFGQHFQDVNGINTHINPNEGNLSVASTSSLTPTAGEFVPRQPSELPVTGSGDSRKFYSNRFNTSDEYKSSLSSFNSSEQSNMSRRNGPKPETKYYNPVRNLSSQKHETPFNRRRGNGRGGLDGNSVSSNASNMDRIKNDERERLLLEAAAFLTPTNNAELKPEVNSNKSRKSDRKQEDNLEPHANRAFSSSSKSNEYPSSYRNNMKQQYSSSNWKKRSGNNYYNQPNSGTSVLQQRNAVDYTAETYGNSGRKIHNQNRYNNSSNNVTTYRSPQVQHSSPKSNSSGGYNNTAKGDDDSSQRERLTEQLARGTLECLVCCDRVRQHDPVWSCTNCYHVLHLKCIKKWATSSKAESGWRCPACQNVTAEIPEAYYCFCGKVREPEWNRMDAAHSCGQMCGRPRTDKHPDCTHRCTLLCHPGPCPSCVAQVNRSCGCGKMFQIVKCGSDKPLLCGAVCDRVLNCSAHYCKNVCHIGSCTECQEKIIQVCYCKKETREVPCTRDSLNTKEFSCEETCEKTLSCGNHKCSQKCHPGTCPECELTPDKVTRCPCGKTPLKEDEQRSSCLDPVPTCGMKCNKTLNCGQPGEPHTCQLNCHSGPCPVCPLSTSVKCRCGNMFRDIPCKELPTRGTDARCEKKCTKKRSCGKHKCNQLCCIDPDHICPLPCNHQLSCGQHRCEENCHRGRCPPCWRMSFEELFCECGSSVLYPPISCGTRRPECTKPCSRPHPCEHPALHNCHSQPTCPPCTVLTKKYCHGKHELRKSIPCHQEDFSCGLPCNVPLPCGRHNCILPCHKDQCLKEGQNCTQPCTTPRAVCGHNCATPCHEGPCPDTPCKEMVKVTCECGHRSTSRACSDNAKEYQRIATSLLASKMADMQLGHSVDLGDMLSIPSARKMSLKTLECNEECKIIERNRRLAIGLQIRNPDLSAKLTPRYSDYMKQWAKKDPQFCGFVHDKLSELVKLAKESKQKSRSYSFDVMNREKRHFVHEYCEHFGCESVAYDREPKRNVVATAAKDKSWLPGMSLLEVVKRESGQRTIPKPVITSNRVPSERTMDILPVKCSQSQAPAIPEKPAGPSSSEKTGKHEDEIDYFDFT